MRHSRRSWRVVMAVACGLWAGGCGSDMDDPDSIELGPLGGETTSESRSSRAFEQPAPNLSQERLETHRAGDKTFGAEFVSEPADTRPGLGPLFNNNSCVSCHVRNGRGLPKIDEEGLRSQMLVRISDPRGEPVHPGGQAAAEGFGLQIQDQAVWEAEPEADVTLEWQTKTGTYGDGTEYELRYPDLEIEANGERTFRSRYRTSLRQPPPVFGLGLLEAIPDARLRELADPNDADGDGISGRLNRVWDQTTKSGNAIGRFGHKANIPNLQHQTGIAYAEDMGVSNPVFRLEGDGLDIGPRTVARSELYVQTLGVPARRKPVSDEARRGHRLFRRIGCNDCHVETHETGDHPIEALADQTIHPFTDLLLHDMGPGLADERSDFRATGSEWRTPPLWGIGATQRVAPGAGYLHDGRARTLDEAILWHGGEAEQSREKFRKMSEKDRQALLEFLRSL